MNASTPLGASSTTSSSAASLPPDACWPAVCRPIRRPACCCYEAGGKDNWIWFHIPVGYLFAMGNPRADWMFKTEEEPGLNGRALNYPRGKVIGGCSAINGMISMRGQSADYDHWRQLGLRGWGWDDVLPIFRRLDGHFLQRPAEHHGNTLGEWRSRGDAHQLADPRRGDRGKPDGRPNANAGFNTGDNNGVGYFHVNQKRGFRMSTARAFLEAPSTGPNLRLETGVLVEKVLFVGCAARSACSSAERP